MARPKIVRPIEEKQCRRCGAAFARNPKYSDRQWSTAFWCSRACSAWNKGLTAADDPRLAQTAKRVAIWSLGRPGWSKGLTKETHPSLAIVAHKVSAAQKGRPVTAAQKQALALGHGWGRGLTAASTPSIARRGRAVSSRTKGVANPDHAARMQAFYAEKPHLHPNAILARKTRGRGMTHIERVCSELLAEMGLASEYNGRIGRFWPDFKLASASLVIEADGERWHRDRAKDEARDAILMGHGWSVLHLAGAAIVSQTARCRQAILDAVKETEDGSVVFSKYIGVVPEG